MVNRVEKRITYGRTAQRCSLLATFNCQDADLSEVAPIAQNHKLRDAIVGDHSQFALLDDVHFPTDVALLADVVAWTVDLRLQLQHQFHQQTGLAVSEDTNLQDHTHTHNTDAVSWFTFKGQGSSGGADLLQSVQVDVDGDFGSQFVGQVLQHLALVHRLFIGPQEVEPLDDTFLQVRGHLESGQQGS